MIGAVSASSAAPLRPISVKPLACACMACAPQRVLSSPAAPISLSAPAVSPALNVAANETSKISIDRGSDAENPTTTANGLAKPKGPNGKDGEAKNAAAEGETTKSANGQELTAEEKAQVAKLRARDREVRAHEQAHAAVGGALAGAPSYSYQTGPDGKQYAVGGEVPIRTTASSGSPRQAIAQLQQVARAASAPASPSGQDRAVAAQARAQIAQIQAQLAQEAQAKAQEALERPEEQETEAPASTGLPDLPDLPEIAAPTGRTAGSAAPAPAGPATPSAGAGAVPSHTRSADGGNSTGTHGGPIDIARRGAGPIAAYQQTDSHHGKPPTITGRIISLNA